MSEDKKQKLLEVKNLHVSFFTPAGEVKAVNGISYDVDYDEVMGIVGESGSGKSVEAYSIIGLLQSPGKVMEGSITLEGEDMLAKTPSEMVDYRGSQVAMIFQNPMTCLNPVYTIGNQLTEALRAHDKSISKEDADKRAMEMLEQVGINNVEKRMKQYPHELSGGMKQRVMIAIALVGSPSIVIADEPTTSLDVTIEAQILDVLKNLQKTLGTSIILITHDLGVIAKLCDRVLVMYGGKIVERGSVDEIFYDTAHPYTKGLMHSIAKLDTARGHKLQPIEGTPPDLFAPPKGCPFAARCEYCMEICKDMPPQTYELSKEHETCCWLQHEYAPDTDMRRKVTEKGEV